MSRRVPSSLSTASSVSAATRTRHAKKRKKQQQKQFTYEASGDTTASEDEAEDGSRGLLFLRGEELSIKHFTHNVSRYSLRFRHCVLTKETNKILAEMQSIVTGESDKYKKELEEIFDDAKTFREALESECDLELREYMDDMRTAIRKYTQVREDDEIDVKLQLRNRLSVELNEVKRAIASFDDETNHKCDKESEHNDDNNSTSNTTSCDKEEQPHQQGGDNQQQQQQQDDKEKEDVAEEHEEDDEKFAVPALAKMHRIVDHLSGRKTLPKHVKHKPKRVHYSMKQTNGRIAHPQTLDIDTALLSLSSREISDDLKKMVGFDKVPGKLVKGMRRKERPAYYNVPVAYLMKKGSKEDDMEDDNINDYITQ
eukprot:m.42372 g.42372  ORF g.42372 m.42372 type:complete len:369 (-) comp10507_c0_seq1:62-1168(-)